ncbi:hypothetical protein D3M71_17905 [Erwinia billingiae]|nr:hypothetical protein [Erwinia billingiae]
MENKICIALPDTVFWGLFWQGSTRGYVNLVTLMKTVTYKSATFVTDVILQPGSAAYRPSVQ